MSVPSPTTCTWCLLATLLVAWPVQADGRDGRGRDARVEGEGEHGRARPQRGQDALADSVRRIERDKRGQVLSAERVPYDGRDINRIKVVDDRGRVRVYMDDPARPEPLRTRGDDD